MSFIDAVNFDWRHFQHILFSGLKFTLIVENWVRNTSFKATSLPLDETRWNKSRQTKQAGQSKPDENRRTDFPDNFKENQVHSFQPINVCTFDLHFFFETGF